MLMSGCQKGHTSNPRAARQTRRVAASFAKAYLEAPDRKTALARIKPFASASALEVAPDEYASIFGHFREHVVAGPRPGCDGGGSSGGDHCYTFSVVGDRFIPDPINKGYASFGYGLMFVSVGSGDRPKVDAVTYAGGVRECKLDANCAPARRARLKRARKFLIP
jgi:hypothetical protein